MLDTLQSFTVNIQINLQKKKKKMYVHISTAVHFDF